MSNRTEISTLGEFGLIRHLTDKIELKNPSTLKGVGDDAAVLLHRQASIGYDRPFAGRYSFRFDVCAVETSRL